MHINFLVVALTSIIPLLVGFVWYNDNVMGTIWRRESGTNPQPANMMAILGASLLLSFLIAVSLLPATIHAMGLYSLLVDEPGFFDPNSEVGKTFSSIMTKYGSNFRTFKHGAFHGIVTTVCLLLPVISINALFERKSWKYIAIHVGYWAICMALMGGIICAFA
ncbi:MAG: hypothetical protein RLZZ628_1095 [Bacteroidota bacterium]|jgi:hypothetical protein